MLVKSVLLVASVLLGLANSGEERRRIHERLDRADRFCQKKFGLRIASITDVLGYDETPENIQCFVKCFLEETGAIVDGLIQLEAARSVLLVSVDGRQDTINSIVAECIPGALDAGTCSQVFKMFDCYVLEAAKYRGLAVKGPILTGRCLNKLELNDTAVPRIINADELDIPNPCLIECVMERYGFLVDGRFRPDNLAKELALFLKHNETEILSVIEPCTNIHFEDTCVLAENVLRCLYPIVRKSFHI